MFVTGPAGHIIHNALEDDQAAIVDDEPTVMVTKSIDQLDNALSKSLNKEVKDTAVYPSPERIWDDWGTVRTPGGDKIEVLLALDNVF